MTHNCLKCKSRRHYSQRFDTYYCATCNTWLEPACDEPNCSFCAKRPATPRDYYIHKVESKDNLIGDLMSLEDFNDSVECGSITSDDGSIGSVFIDGVQHPEIEICGWGMAVLDSPFLQAHDLESLEKAYAGKAIEIEWCNK